MSDRWFTPDSARRTLRSLRPAAERMCRVFRTMQHRRPSRIVPDQPVDRAYFLLLQQLHAALLEIRGWGVQVRDPQAGLLDFPARREGRRVVLCWKVGEPSLEFWRETGAALAERRRVDDDGPWDES